MFIPSQGYVKASTAVFGPGDKALYKHDDELEEDDIEDMGVQAMVPSNINFHYWKLVVHVFRCENIPKVDPCIL
jgi:hypothetical protein